MNLPHVKMIFFFLSHMLTLKSVFLTAICTNLSIHLSPVGLVPVILVVSPQAILFVGQK